MDLNQYRGLNTGKFEAVPTASTYVTETDVDRSLKHFFILLFLGGGLGVLASWLLSSFNAAPSLGTLVPAVLGMCLLLLVFVFQSLLLKSFQLFLWVTLAQVFGLLSFFLTALNPWIVFGAIVLIGYAASGFLRGRLDLTDHLTIHFGRFSKIIMAAVITGLAFFLSFFYVGLYRTNGVSFDAFRFIAAGGEPVLRQFVPEYNAELGADEFFRQFARAQLASNPQFVLLLSADQDAVVAQTGYQLRSQITQVTKTSPQMGETFEHYLYRISVHYLEMFSGEQLQIIPIFLFVFVIYGVIRGVMFVGKWPVILVSYLLYRILISLRLVYITTEPRSKEIIMLK